MTRRQSSAVVGEVPRQLLIGGEWRDASSGRTLAAANPADGETLCEVADAATEDAKAALDAACDAPEEWAASAPNERSDILSRAFDALDDRADELALPMTLEMGKTVAESTAEIAFAAEFWRWLSGEALRLDGYYKEAGNGASRVLVMREPGGPCYCITPWNVPTAMGTRKIGPAIAAGCTMVAKPAQQTPLSMLALAKVLEECGLPPGVLNVVTGSSATDISKPIIAHPRLRKLSFTGSTEVGRRLIAQAAEYVLKVSMELGGSAPFLVFEDADLDAAVEGAMVAKMRNICEACTAANRFYVAEGIAGDFTERLGARMGALKLGRGTDADAQVGPLIDADQRAKVAELVDDAVDKGAECVVGGGIVDGPGYFFEPRVITDVADDARLLSEEIFGPVAPVKGFANEEGAIAAAYDAEYGLAAYVHTADQKRAMRVCEALETEMIGLKQGPVSTAGAPFGGVKHSGIGREGGNEGVLEFLEPKYIASPR